MADLDGILAAVRRLADMTNDVLDVGRLESQLMDVSIAPMDLGPLVRSVVEERLALTPGPALEVGGLETASVACDQALARRILKTLLTNACDHSARDRSVRVALLEEEGRVRVEIHDHGPPIPDECVDQVFEKQGSVHARQAGTFRSLGLGLTFCKLAAEAQDGAVGVRRREDEGNIFWFTLPRA